jgi:membrane-bound metal-dependent hydrolase YbcI (DUF457 family)
VHLPTHALVSWLVAESAPLSPRQRALVLAAGLLPDLDALTLLGGVEAYQRWHRVVLHNGLAALICAGLFAALGARGAQPGGRAPALATALLVVVSFHLHLLGDLLGSAGPDGSIWPIPYLVPFSAREFAWSGQWGLASWQNVSLTAALLAVCAALGARRGRTLLEAVSASADAAVVEVLRRRLPWAVR